MATATIENFPKHKLGAARAALEGAYKRFARSAARAGQEAPAAPEIVVVAERVSSRCTDCGCSVDGFAGGTCLACREGYLVAREVVDLEVRGARPKLAGWEFLAVVEPLVGGNLIRQVPHADVADGELDPWRSSELRCDHCRAARHRKETFIVRADGSDPAIPAGTYKQVGRNCLESFLGGRSPAAIVASLGWEDLVRGASGDGEGGWGGGGPSVYDPAVFMAWVASSARQRGFTSRATAREQGGSSTADHAQYLLTPPFGGGARDRWQRDRAEFTPTESDKARGEAALAWARELTGASDYERNLKLVAAQPALEPAHAGILASAIAGHARALGEEVKRRAHEAQPSRHLGAKGDKLSLEVTVERTVTIPTSYGAMHIVSMRGADGAIIVWRTGTEVGVAPGDAVSIRGTVKAHTEFRGEAQTELTRCKITKA